MIIVIDDSKTIRSILKDYLTKIGYSVRVADDGVAGIDLYNSIEKIDAVLTDIDMPFLDGNHVAQHIRTHEKDHTPILAVTGSDDSLIAAELFDRILHKPLRVVELKSALMSIIKDSNLRKSL